MVTVTPLMVSLLEVGFPQPFHSVLWDLNSQSQPTWQPGTPPGSLLSESGGTLFPHRVPFLWSPQRHFSPPVLVHLCSSCTQAPLQSSQHPSVTSGQGATLRKAILRPCPGLMLWLHRTGCDVSTLVFGGIVLPTGQLYQLCYLLHSFRPDQLRHPTQGLWPLRASLANELLGIQGTSNLVWVGKGIE